MLRFRGFKASFNFNSSKQSGVAQYTYSGVALSGAYRRNKDDLFGSPLYSESPKTISPSMVKLPTKQSGSPMTQWKSTSNLTKHSNQATNITKSTPDLSQATNSQQTPVNPKEHKKVEKQRLADQKKQEKLAAKEREREEKIKKEREREEKIKKEKERQEQIKNEKKKYMKQTKAAQDKNIQKKSKKQMAPQPQKQKKQIAPQPQQQQKQIAPQPQQQQKQIAPQPQQQQKQIAAQPQQQQKQIAPQPQQQQKQIAPHPQQQQKQIAPQPQQQQKQKAPQPQQQQKRFAPQPQQEQKVQTNKLSKIRSQRPQSTNSLESSISKSSGPPPYTSVSDVPPSRSHDTKNTSFVQPEEDMSSWDFVSQHRQQMNRQVGAGRNGPKQKQLDLNYNISS